LGRNESSIQIHGVVLLGAALPFYDRQEKHQYFLKQSHVS